MSSQIFDVAIVGGGISGLSTAWYLQQAGISYTVLESSDRWGGKIQTEETAVAGAAAPFIIEAGPDSFLTQKPWAWQLARELGMEDRFLPTNDHKRQTFVLNKGRPTPLPDGVMLIVPTRIAPFALSPLISWPGKLRMGLDLFIKPRTDGRDETLAEFVERRLGSEALDKIAEPLLSGIYNAEAEKQSLLATFPRFRDVEEKHGSLIKGMVAARRAGANGSGPSPNGRKPPSMFMSFKGGMRELIEGLVPRLSGDLRLSTAVAGLETTDNAFALMLNDGSRLVARHVVLAVPAYVAADLLADLTPDAATILRDIRYVSTGTISLAYRRDTLTHSLDGFGIVIPRSERRCINAVTWTSTKFDGRAPEKYALLRVFFGGSRTPEMMDLPDAALVTAVRAELQALMGIDAPPLFQRIYRWHDANPQYDVGHLDRVTAVEAALPPGLHVTGSPYRGIGVPDCVKQAKATAEQVAASLSQMQPEQPPAAPLHAGSAG